MPEVPSASTKESRRPVTILFTDIVGSSAFFAERGDAAGLAMLQRHNSLLVPVVTAAGGRVVKTIGDSIFAVFGNPGQAVRAAWAMQQRLEQHNKSAAEGQQIRIRIGVHYGLVTEQKGDVFGDAVNMAERVKSKAAAGQVILSRTVRDLLRADPAIQVRTLGQTELKGSPEPIELFELTSAPALGPAEAPKSRILLMVAAAGGLLVALAFILWLRSTLSAPGTTSVPSKPVAARLQPVAAVSLLHFARNGVVNELSPIEAVFRSREKFQISYRPQVAHCLYAAFYDVGSQRFTLVFPLADTLQPLRADEKILIPGDNVSFTLDDQPRTEIILLVLSPQPLPELDSLAQAGQASAERLRDVLQQVKTHGDAARLSLGSPTQALVEAPLGDKAAWVELHIEHR